MTDKKTKHPAKPIKLKETGHAKIDELRREKIEYVKETCPVRVRPFIKAYNRASPMNAIKAFCFDCMGFMSVEVGSCTAYACLLWNYRPYQPKPNDPSDFTVRPEPEDDEDAEEQDEADLEAMLKE